MMGLRWTFVLLSVCLPLLAVADLVTGDDASGTFELLHSQEEPDLSSDVGFESGRSGFLAVFRPRTGGVIVEFHRSSPWAHASAVQASIKNMMDGLLSGPLQASGIFRALEAQQQQLMSIHMQRQVELAAAAANPSDQALAYAAMLPRRPCPRHQAMMMAAKRMEAEGAAAEVQSALMSALTPSFGSVRAEVMAMDPLPSQTGDDAERLAEYEDTYSDSPESFLEEDAANAVGPDAEESVLEDVNYDHDDDWEESDFKSSDVYSDYASSDDSDDLNAGLMLVDSDDSYSLPAMPVFPADFDLCQFGFICLGFSVVLLLLFIQAMRAQQAQQQALAAHREAELQQPLLYMSPAEVLAAVEKVPGAAVMVEAPSGAAMRWENPVYYERLQGKE